MIGLQERAIADAPSTYQEWLDCFERMKEVPLSNNRDFEVLSLGTFAGARTMQAAFERQMVDTVNVVLNKSTKRFVRDLNDRIVFNELAQVDVLFKRLKKDIHKATFFVNLSFLSNSFKAELYRSVAEQMTAFWDNMIAFLQQQANDFPNSDLEDALFLIRRIKLF